MDSTVDYTVNFPAGKRESLDIAVIQLPFISNYTDDLEPFLYEQDVSIRWVELCRLVEFGHPDASHHSRNKKHPPAL